MPAFISVGRFLFAILFIVSGAMHLFDLAGTTEAIAGKVTMPVEFADYITQLQGMSGMPMAKMLAIGAGVLELLGGLMIALNFGARFFAVLLILFVIAATFYFHDFWNQTWPDAKANLIQALKNLSLIGGLLMIVGAGRAPHAEVAYPEPAASTY
ncbi:MAG TPA: DoxX family protein [Xanthobacteraceae bacterium]|nr:DoxX family protein [Xanthobacteraceae bacterium]